MHVNFGYFINKFRNLINRPALRDCKIDKTAKVGSGSNCIKVHMGRYSYMGKNNSVYNASIGAFCSIASYCAIGGGCHPIEAVSTSPVFCAGRNIFHKNFGDYVCDARMVTIGNDVWIGEGVFIRAGVSIGNGAVVGAHSVVTHNIPPYAIVTGAPAKVMRYRFSESTIAKLQRLQWWDWTEKELMQNGHRFISTDELLEESRK